MDKVKVYGAGWCEDTRRTRDQLERMGVPHDYVDIEQDEASARWVRDQNDGKERKPTLKVGDKVLSTPDNEELETALRAEGLLR